MEVQMKKTAKGILILTVVAIFGITTLAFAGWGRGYGHMMGSDRWGHGMHSEYGYDQGGYYGNCCRRQHYHEPSPPVPDPLLHKA